jgi:transcription initiation factor IIE alpha subunit
VDIRVDHVWLSVPCPVCQYEVEFTFLQARLQEAIFCPCCKRTIQLVDETGSVEVGKREVDEAVTDFERTIAKLNRALRFRL